MTGKELRRLIINFIIGFLIIIVIGIANKYYRENTVWVVIAEVVCIIVLVVFFLLPIFAFIVNVFRKGIHNIRHCDIPLFEGIDALLGYSKSNKEQWYRHIIGAINYLYKAGGEVDAAVRVKSIDLIFHRRDFLKRSLEFADDLNNIMISFFVSAVSSFSFGGITMLIKNENAWISGAFIIIGLGLFVFIPYLKHIDKDINGSFVYKIREYEARLLDEKIDNLERQIEIRKLEYNVLLGVNKICEIVLAKNKGCFKSIRAKKDVNMLKKLELIYLCINFVMSKKL